MASQHPRNNYRPLAPKGTEIEHPPPSRSTEDARLKRASTACGECKIRRTKCTSEKPGFPCTECVLHDRECVIDESADKRRKIAARETEENLRKAQQRLQRTQSQMEHYRHYSHHLVNMIRYAETGQVDRLVSVIRLGSSDQAIQEFLSQYTHMLPPFNFETAGGSNSPEVEDGISPGYGGPSPSSR